jgi:hypothetical protein
MTSSPSPPKSKSRWHWHKWESPRVEKGWSHTWQRCSVCGKERIVDPPLGFEWIWCPKEGCDYASYNNLGGNQSMQTHLMGHGVQ